MDTSRRFYNGQVTNGGVKLEKVHLEMKDFFEQKQLEHQLRPKEPTKCEEFCKNLYGYSLMLWDGLGFFGTDHMKLGRL